MKSIHFDLSVLAILLATTTASHADLIAYEGFDTAATYTLGNSITGVNGGTGWSSLFTTTAFSCYGANPGLVSGTLQTTTGQATVALDPFNSFSFCVDTRTFPPVSTGDLWVSWLYSPGAPETIYSGLGLSRTSGGELFYIGTDGNGQFRIDTSVGGGSNATYGPLTTGTRFIVAHLDFATGSMNIYQNPTPGVALGAPLASFSGLTLAEVSSLVFLGGANGITSFDEIRIGTTYADVAPPAVFNARITSAQLTTGNTLFQIDVAGLEGGKNYKLQESLLLDGFADVPDSQFTAASSTQILTLPVDPLTVPKHFFRIADVP